MQGPRQSLGLSSKKPKNLIWTKPPLSRDENDKKAFHRQFLEREKINDNTYPEHFIDYSVNVTMIITLHFSETQPKVTKKRE